MLDLKKSIPRNCINKERLGSSLIIGLNNFTALAQVQFLVKELRSSCTVRPKKKKWGEGLSMTPKDTCKILIQRWKDRLIRFSKGDSCTFSHFKHINWSVFLEGSFWNCCFLTISPTPLEISIYFSLLKIWYCGNTLVLNHIVWVLILAQLLKRLYDFRQACFTYLNIFSYW